MSWLTFHFGFSYIGAVFLALLFVPNLLWVKNRPQGYDSGGESRFLLALERIGEILVTCLFLINADLNLRSWSPWVLWLVLAGGLLAPLLPGRAYPGGFLRLLLRRACGGGRAPRAGRFLHGALWKKPVAPPFVCDFGRGAYRDPSGAQEDPQMTEKQGK